MVRKYFVDIPPGDYVPLAEYEIVVTHSDQLQSDLNSLKEYSSLRSQYQADLARDYHAIKADLVRVKGLLQAYKDKLEGISSLLKKDEL